MLAVDPDEFEAQTYQIEALVNRNDDLGVELKAAQAGLKKLCSAITVAAGHLAAIKERVAGLPTCSTQNIEAEIRSIVQQVDAALTALKQEVVK
jgi:hypothetical protein